MDLQTIQNLNHLNAEFYRSIGKYFDETRQQYWQGWDQVLLHTFPTPKEITVLDIGCGNGRFTSFLANKGFQFQYIGLDNSEYLITQARERYHFPHNTFIHFDFVESDLHTIQLTQFDLIALFGVMHHIPSHTKRMDLLHTLAAKLNPSGYLVFTLWDFLNESQLATRAADWVEFPEIDTTQLETGDYLLDWQRGAKAVRYCHDFNETEKKEIEQALSLRKVCEFRADGKNGESNVYIILQK